MDAGHCGNGRQAASRARRERRASRQFGRPAGLLLLAALGAYSSVVCYRLLRLPLAWPLP